MVKSANLFTIARLALCGLCSGQFIHWPESQIGVSESGFPLALGARLRRFESCRPDLYAEKEK